jgi:hypothetical protein
MLIFLEFSNRGLGRGLISAHLCELPYRFRFILFSFWGNSFSDTLLNYKILRNVRDANVILIEIGFAGPLMDLIVNSKQQLRHQIMKLNLVAPQTKHICTVAMNALAVLMVLTFVAVTSTAVKQLSQFFFKRQQQFHLTSLTQTKIFP